MCLPLAAAAAIGLAVASSGLQAVTAIQAAKQQTKAINAQNDERQKEIDQAATSEINDRMREARREQARIMVAAGESGLNLGSGSVEALLMDSAQQAGLADSESLANRESRKKAAAMDAQAHIPARQTALGAGLQIALAGAKAGFSAAASSERSGGGGGD